MPHTNSHARVTAYTKPKKRATVRKPTNTKTNKVATVKNKKKATVKKPAASKKPTMPKKKKK